MRGDRSRSEVRNPPQRPHMRFTFQTMMSSQIHPPSAGAPDEPFHSRCHSQPRPFTDPTPKHVAFHDRAQQEEVPAQRLSGAQQDGGARRDRTDDLMLAKHALYQLSYGPFSRPAQLKRRRPIHLPARGVTRSVVGPGRLELPTSRLSGVCSNQLSYRP